MTDQFVTLQSTRVRALRCSLAGLTSRLVAGTIIPLSLWAGTVLAADPFRVTAPKPIGERTEAVFRALFERGDYSAATRRQLNEAEQAEVNEPLVYALQASMTFIDFQNEKDKAKKTELLERLRLYGEKTRTAAQALITTDPLRGNLYTAVSHFLEGGHILLRDGTVKGAPSGLSELQQAFKAMDAAAAIAPDDPELNLVKGFMDLIISVNLPFSSPSQAISRLEKYAGPKYLADRGIAIGYRDLKQPEKALEAVDRAIKLTPDNPELMYLKAQILVRQGNHQASLEWFEKALKQRQQLPAGTVKQIKREQSRVKESLGITEKK